MRIKKLSRDEIEIVKIILALVEGFDTVEKISRITKLKKYYVTHILYTLKHAGFLSVKPGTKQWRINVNASFFGIRHRVIRTSKEFMILSAS